MELPKSVRDFIRTYLSSAEQLEILCLLRLKANLEWTACSVSKELRTNPASTAKRLENLAAASFLTRRSASGELFYRYAPSASLTPHVEEFFQYFPTYRLKVYEAIFSPGIENVRAFSDSFKLRKDDDE